jgi:hypothetical protein
VAISVAWQTVASIAATSTVSTFYTVPSASTASYGSYARDLVVNNSGAGNLFVCLSVAGAVTAAAGFQVPAGGTVILTECAVPAGAIVGVANTTTTASNVSAGFATNVNYF